MLDGLDRFLADVFRRDPPSDPLEGRRVTYFPVAFGGLCLDCDVVFNLLQTKVCPVCGHDGWVPLSRITGRTS
jgi:hypothetical protein